MYTCNHCNNKFKKLKSYSNHLLKKHKDLSMLDEKLICKTCKQEKFISQFYLNSNSCKECSKVKCEICNESLANKSNLKRHNKLVHEMNKGNKKINQERLLEKEIQREYEEKYTAYKLRKDKFEIDLVNKEYIFEIKKVSSFHHCLGQLLTYHEFFPEKKKKAILFSLEDISEERKEFILKLFSKYNIEVEFIIKKLTQN